jgi:hypothetical protein
MYFHLDAARITGDPEGPASALERRPRWHLVGLWCRKGPSRERTGTPFAFEIKGMAFLLAGLTPPGKPV